MAADNPFTAWLELQLELQREVFVDPRIFADNGDEEGRSDFLLWNAYAATDEIHEAMQEVGWKPWASSRHLNRDQFLGEIVDALHFVANMVLAAAVSRQEEPRALAEVLWAMYQSKVEKNIQRQLLGYDGVTGKCPICKRELVPASDGFNGELEVMVCPEHGEVQNVTRVQSPQPD